MKKALLGLVAVGFMAASVNAATLSLRWAGTAGDKVSLAPSDTAVIEVVMDLTALDNLAAAFFSYESQPLVTLQANGTTVPGWASGGLEGAPLGPASQFAVSAVAPADALFGPQSVVIGTSTLHLDPGDPVGTVYEVAISNTIGQGIVLLNSTGGAYTFGPNFDGAIPNFYDIGKGSPGIPDGGLGGSPRDPLLITVVPEPASIALLAIGGFGLVMRRRR